MEGESLLNDGVGVALFVVFSGMIGTIPDGFDRKGFSLLFTWGGLRGGLSIALAMSTADLLPEETYHILLGCVYAIVFFTTVVQGLSMKKVYTGIVGGMTGSET